MAVSGRTIVAGIVVLAFLRVFAGASAFPLFNHLDEFAHADLVVRYAMGRLPSRGDDRFLREMAELNALYNSPEYAAPPGPDGYVSARDFTPAALSAFAAAQARQHSHLRNYEAFAPPLYYAGGAVVYRIARAAGSDELRAMYQVRFAGALCVALGVWFAYRFMRLICPERPLVWLGVPLLLAVFPQDVVYGINSDLPAVLLYPLAFEMLFRARREDAGAAVHAGLGLAVGATFWVKSTGAVLVVVAFAMSVIGLRRAARAADRRRWRRELLGLALLVLAVLGMVVVNLTRTGHPVDTAHKTEVFGFRPQDMAGVLAHPILRPAGMWEFVMSLAISFWRGELHWHGDVMRHAAMDALYVTTSIALPLVSLQATLRRRPGHLPAAVALPCWLAVAIAVGANVVLSLCWKYPESGYPSSAFPYFASGRNVISVAAPFLLLWVDGLARLLGRPRLAAAALALFAASILVSEAILTAPVIGSRYNW